MLFTICAEQPSATLLAYAGVPRWLNVAIFDLGNVLLLAGIMLFPHGTLSWRRVGLHRCPAVPHVPARQGVPDFFIGFMVSRSCRYCAPCESRIERERQQIRWALLGFTGYALLRCLSIVADYMKWSSGQLWRAATDRDFRGDQLCARMLTLQIGLLIALLRFRLYDAEFVISKSANVALITVTVAAVFAAVQPTG